MCCSEAAVCGVYRVNTAAFTLSAQVEEGLAPGVVGAALRGVHVSGRPLGETYGQLLYPGDWKMLSARTDLCSLVLAQKVAKKAYAQLADVIQQVWQEDGGKQRDVCFGVLDELFKVEVL
jgi:hypothetical protein